jgi:hypothetical protein
VTSKEALTLLVGREPSSRVLLRIFLDFSQFRVVEYKCAKRISYVGLTFWVFSNWRFEIFEGTKLHIVVFWDMTLCILISGWQHIYPYGSWRKYIPSKTWCSVLGYLFTCDLVSSLGYVASDNGIILYTPVLVPGDTGRLGTRISVTSVETSHRNNLTVQCSNDYPLAKCRICWWQMHNIKLSFIMACGVPLMPIAKCQPSSPCWNSKGSTVDHTPAAFCYSL